MSAERLTHAHPLIGPRKRGRAAFRASRATDIRHSLDERKRLNRLPGEKEFWELVRIALDERPASFYDDLRLRACLIQILMGLRVGEVATLPANTLHARDLTTAQGGRPSAGWRARPHPVAASLFREAGRCRCPRHRLGREVDVGDHAVRGRHRTDGERYPGQDGTASRTAEGAACNRPHLPRARTRTNRWASPRLYPRVTGNPVVCGDDPETASCLLAD